MPGDFNTKKVRLKPGQPDAVGQRSLAFQYQKGAIKTHGARLRDVAAQTFQYQKGAIKTGLSGFLLIRLISFQYQKGAIKTCA